MEEGDGEVDEEGLEEAVKDENSGTFSEDGEADEESEDSSNAEGNGEESDIRKFSKNRAESETSEDSESGDDGEDGEDCVSWGND